MSDTLIIVAGMVVTYGLGFAVGWEVSLWRMQMRKKPTTSEVRDYMAAAVNREEAEELRRRTRLDMARSGARTTRSDGGPRASVQRMRKRRNKTPRQID